MNSKFDDIAPLYDHEVSQAIQELLADPGFIHAVKYVLTDLPWEDFVAEMSKYRTKYDFQVNMTSPFAWGITHKTATSLSDGGFENLDPNAKYLYLSNHRDIVLDAGLLNCILDKKGVDTTEIAIGDNLLVYPWIDKLVRLNKSFIVKRGVSVRQMLEVSKHLSEYIHYTINEKRESVWLAQREGRAKDGNDHTQDSLLKMLALYPDKGAFIDNIQDLNIVPLSITYEYDPCDYLKAQEFQLKRDNPEYKKSQRDDLLNMETGLLGFKGNIYFHFGKPINNELEKLKNLDKKSQITETANCIDREIYRNYKIYPCNYVAYDLLYGTNNFTDKYSQSDITDFESYMSKQIGKIDIPNKDFAFLRERLLQMYSNPLKNQLSVTQNVV